MIESYDFGKIVIDGQEHTADVIVFPDRAPKGWRRKEGHSLAMEDLGGVLDYRPGTLVVGTGYSGGMKVGEKTKALLESRGIKVIARKTKDACAEFNRLLSGSRKVVGAFHLTC